jgi:hypothetical protein
LAGSREFMRRAGADILRRACVRSLARLRAWIVAMVELE